MNIFTLLLIIILIGIVWCLLTKKSDEDFEAVPGSHRPYAGDFLPTVGYTPEKGGYEDLDDEGDVSQLDAKLCEECVSHCVGEKVRQGQSTTFAQDRQDCFRFCKIECDPEAGF